MNPRRAKLVEQAVAANPPRLRSINPAIPKDLETIVLKAIARDPAMRYQTAGELAEDLRRYQEDRPIRARRASSAEMAFRWCRRNPAVAGLLTAVLVSLSGGVAVSSILAVRADRAADRATLSEAEAVRRTDQATAAAAAARQRLVRLYVSTGAKFQDAGDSVTALLWFHRAWEQEAGDPMAEVAHRTRLAGTLAELPELLGACFHSSKVRDAVFSPDGSRVLIRTDGNEAILWDYTTSTPVAPPLRHGGRVRHVCYSPDGAVVATASADGTACLWDAATGAKRHTLRHDGPLTWVEFHPDGKRLLTTSEDKTVRLWDVADGKPLDWKLPTDAVIDYATFSPDGQRLLTAGQNNAARVWTVDPPALASPKLPHNKPTDRDRYEFNQDSWPKFGPDGKTVVSFTGSSLHVWSGGDSVRNLPVGFAVIEVHPVPGTDRVLVTGSSETAKVVELTGGSVAHTLLHPRDANIGAVSRDGKWLLTLSSGGPVHLWDAATGKPAWPAQRCGDFCSAVAFSRDGSKCLASSQDGTVRV